ncbi:hypothetical protein SADUNF_Sadunf11G0105400 [Salix dunnii]|uniref:Uncharacterized protein n=1 Tax=Salix dunnii TaxID=1413687 RepID=A0A835MPJ1_9ROSI|nr:hypothetical protein SADUNF_Sadunf11G0105400 [Salix dunnii]
MDYLHTSRHLKSRYLKKRRISTPRLSKADFLLVLRPYMWDILGCLAIHCREDFNPKIHGRELLIDILIRCAWSMLSGIEKPTGKEHLKQSLLRVLNFTSTRDILGYQIASNWHQLGGVLFHASM